MLTLTMEQIEAIIVRETERWHAQANEELKNAYEAHASRKAAQACQLVLEALRAEAEKA